jgi:hypothetical protein
MIYTVIILMVAQEKVLNKKVVGKKLPTFIFL